MSTRLLGTTPFQAAQYRNPDGWAYLGSGLRSHSLGLVHSDRNRPRLHHWSTVALVAVGAFVGFGSALTGTGGPVLLVPVLLTLGVAPLRAVTVSQAVQLPVVVAGSVGYLQTGLVDA